MSASLCSAHFCLRPDVVDRRLPSILVVCSEVAADPVSGVVTDRVALSGTVVDVAELAVISET